MECVACGEELAEAVYFVEDEDQRWPLCRGCSRTVDMRLVLLEVEAQGMIDQFVESIEV